MTISNDLQVSRPVFVTENEVITTGEGRLWKTSKVALNSMADLQVDRLAIGYNDAAVMIVYASNVRTGIADHAPHTIFPRGKSRVVVWGHRERRAGL